MAALLHEYLHHVKGAQGSESEGWLSPPLLRHRLQVQVMELKTQTIIIMFSALKHVISYYCFWIVLCFIFIVLTLAGWSRLFRFSMSTCVCVCVHVCVCLQRAAPTRRVSAMRAASVGATQPSTDKLKVQACSIFQHYTHPSVFCEFTFGHLLHSCFWAWHILNQQRAFSPVPFKSQLAAGPSSPPFHNPLSHQ